MILPLALLFAFGGGFASILLVGRAAVAAGGSPFALVAAQTLISGVMMLVWCRATGRWPRLTPRLAVFFIGTAALGVSIPHIISFTILPTAGAGLTSLVYLLPPLMTYVFALMAGLERADRVKWLAVILGVIGAGIALRSGLRQVADAPVITIVLAVAIPTALSVGNVYRTLAWPKGIDLMAFTAGLLTAGGLMSAGAALAVGAPLPFDSARLVALLAVNVVLTAFSYISFARLQILGGPVYLSQAGLVIAVIGIAGGVVIYDERVPIATIVGIVMVAAALALATWRQFAPVTAAPMLPGSSGPSGPSAV